MTEQTRIDSEQKHATRDEALAPMRVLTADC